MWNSIISTKIFSKIQLIVNPIVLFRKAFHLLISCTHAQAVSRIDCVAGIVVHQINARSIGLDAHQKIVYSLVNVDCA